MSQPSEISLAGVPLGAERHVCAFFQDREEEYRILLPFIRQGLEQGEKAYHIVPAARRADHLERLRRSGLDVAGLCAKGQLEVASCEDAYLRRDGRFDQDAMLAYIERVFARGRAQGYALTRLVADMAWAHETMPRGNALLSYEARLEDLLADADDPVVCSYQLDQFSGQVVMDVLRTHRLAIVGEVLQENPFHVPPAEFLRELAARGS